MRHYEVFQVKRSVKCKLVGCDYIRSPNYRETRTYDFLGR